MRQKRKQLQMRQEKKMISLKDLLDMVFTESIEGNKAPESAKGLSPIRYDLELIEAEDGTLNWVE